MWQFPRFKFSLPSPPHQNYVSPVTNWRDCAFMGCQNPLVFSIKAFSNPFINCKFTTIKLKIIWLTNYIMSQQHTIAHIFHFHTWSNPCVNFANVTASDSGHRCRVSSKARLFIK